MTTFKVLLIDDEPAALEGMQLWIDWERIGFTICGIGSNGVEGLRMIEELQPDLVVTDVNMPLMDGLEMIAVWQAEHGHSVRFVILSGYSEFEYAQRALRYGVNNYLLKPIIPEEAEEELAEIYEELVQEMEKRSFTQIASYEEIVSRIKDILQGLPLDQAAARVLNRVSQLREIWNFCLVQTEGVSFAELRGKAAALLYEEEAMYLIDLEMNRFGIVYGYAPSQGLGLLEQSSCRMIQELVRQYAGTRVFMAVGIESGTLFQIGDSYRTAKEAAVYKFYDSGYDHILRYEQISKRPLNYHYDQLQLLERILGAITLLDQAAFQEAIDTAARSFRELFVAPEVVKKVVIHIMCKIMEYLQETSESKAELLLEKYELPGLSDSVFIMDDLMKLLRTCGMDGIELLMMEQSRQSQGIVNEINDYIREHYHERLTLKKLGEIFYMHPAYLGQLLQKKNGISFNELLHNLRIEEAVHLLSQSQLKNSEIAELVGYSHYGQFFKQFEIRMRMSPNEYKNTMI
ncbi:response regulator transcription factor [Paenibacillus lentus]|uniref:Response regulator n=1 Tax=Paenibacillus lentus TaxID=1338368 RepID=A0A3Q8S431_9BACL|nr:response regulator [Paenibacillus lentus]AZK45722.1 response regulator [Paenibacillus lentus]